MSRNRNDDFYEMDRKYSVPSSCGFKSNASTITAPTVALTMASDDLHAWSIYRQNLNSDFADNALETQEKAPLPYGDFQLRDTTIQSIITDPRYGPKSYLGSNVHNYLKFGLPRVPQPINSDKTSMSSINQFSKKDRMHNYSGSKHHKVASKECSSGYDSSENESLTIQNKRKLKKFGKKYCSNPDFHQMGYLTQTSLQNNYNYQPEGHHNKVLKMKSNSEANLLMSEMQSVYDPNKQRTISRDNGKAPRSNSSYLSNGINFSNDKLPSFTYPHLQIKNLEITDAIKNLTFEIHGGEIMAIISTDDIISYSLLDLISGNNTKYRGGEIFLNGHNISMNIKMLRSKVAFVRNDINFWPEMSVLQILNYYCHLRKPTAKLKHLQIDLKDRINALLEDLGLDQIKTSVISNLTMSEKRRLNVACHLLLDTDIIVLDQPTESMDIFDTFFLIEYLKQWANGGTGHLVGRAIILSLQPPTFEIFSMLSRILLVSNGRVMYCGKRQSMMSYFGSIGFHCPQFKNPADYYLDLITLDDLSADAYAESSQRIEHLAESCQKHQIPLEYCHPGPLPLSITYSNYLKQFYSLILREVIYKQPISIMKWTMTCLMFLMLSAVVGLIFWDIPNTDSQLNLNDRLGYHFAMVHLLVWPLAFFKSRSFSNELQFVKKDCSDKLYGPKMFIFTKVIIQTLPSLLIWTSYLTPAYLLSGLYVQNSKDYYYNGLYTYLETMLVYCYSVELLSMTLHSTISFSILFIIASLVSFNSNYILHYNDLSTFMKWLRVLYPSDQLLGLLLSRELSPIALASSSSTTVCRNKQVQRQDIIVQLACPPPNGTHVLLDYSLPNYMTDTFYDKTMLIRITIFFILVLLILFRNFRKMLQKK